MKEVGFRYIFFHGILNQSMNVYHADPDGTLRLNFNYVDMVLDFLTSTGAIPWVGLDCTPPELVDGEKNFFGGNCMNLPGDLGRWEEVVTGLLGHMVERYSMKLENAPDLLGASVSLTEFTERSLMNPNVFHGGSGVVSFLGFPKAGYHALALLSRLRGKIIAQGDDYMATRSEDGEEVMLMLYHYCHYDRETHLDHQLPIKEQRIYDRYYGFEKKGSRSFQFILDGLAPGEYEADTHLVNRSFGSAYDIWMGMGAPERFTPDQRAYLERLAVPKYQFDRHLVDGSGRLLFSVLLEPHEVRLIHFKKK